MELSRLIAHRGLSAEAPENTEAAFRCAHTRGFRWCETDVTLLGDGLPVLSHDYYLGRCSSAKGGSLADYHRGNYSSLDMGSWFAASYAQQRLPLLREFLGWMRDWQMGVNLELKVEWDNLPIWEPLVQAVAQEISLQRFPLEQLIISSFALPLLYRCRQIFPQLRLGYLLSQPDAQWAKHAEVLGLYSLHVAENLVSREFVEACHRAGLKLLVYTVSELERQKQLLTLGVDALFSDAATELLAWE